MNKRKVNIVAITLLTLVISISGCLTAFAGETTSTAGGNLTDTITWSISGDVLTISGTGAMPDYGWYSNNAPWASDSFSRVEIKNGITSIGSGAFNGCNFLESVTIPESVTSIGFLAFWGCSSLTSIKIPESVTSIGAQAFYNCRLITSIKIPESVTWIGGRAFSDCSSLKSVTIPESVIEIGDRAFSGCSSLTSVTIPESVTSIGEQAFGGCSSLTSVTIPESVTRIGKSAFGGSSKLKKVEILGESRIGPYIFGARHSRDKKMSLFINPKAKMSIKVAIDNPNIDIYTSASSFPDNWGAYNDNLRVKIIYNTSLETFRRLMENESEAHAVKVAKASVKLKAYKGGKLKVTASAKNATGYRVYYKKSTWKKYKTYTKGNIKTLNKTFKKLSKGKYTVKVKAFHKADDGKTTWGADSSVKKITVR